MWFISLRDLRFRRRRFLIATIGSGLVFAMSLVGSGMSQSFRSEAERTINVLKPGPSRAKSSGREGGRSGGGDR